MYMICTISTSLILSENLKCPLSQLECRLKNTEAIREVLFNSYLIQIWEKGYFETYIVEVSTYKAGLSLLD